MSVKWMAAVWDAGPQNPTERLVLLALADYANDAGECWPSINGLCRKTCISERGVQSILKRLEVSGRVKIKRGGGRHQCNFYRIVTPEANKKTPQMDAETPQMDAETPQMDAENPAASAPEPSITVIEPSIRDKGETGDDETERPRRRSDDGADTRPHREPGSKPDDQARQALEAWNQTAKACGLPQAQRLNDARAKALRQRVKEAGSIEAFAAIVRAIPQSPFLMGENDRGWKADIDFICRQSRFLKLQEGGYHGGKLPCAKPEITPEEIEQRRAHAERLKQWEDWSNA